MVIGISQKKYEELLAVLSPDINIDPFIDERYAKVQLKEILDILGVTLMVDGDGVAPDLDVPPLEFDYNAFDHLKLSIDYVNVENSSNK